MSNWPRLSAVALKRIEAIERKAGQDLGDNIRPYTLGNPDLRRSYATLAEGGNRAIDYICDYAETILEGYCREYLPNPGAFKSSGALKGWILPQVRRKADKAWGAYLFATAILPPTDLRTHAKVGRSAKRMVLSAPSKLRARGVSEIVLEFPEGPVDPMLKTMLEGLAERYRVQIDELLGSRVRRWETAIDHEIASRPVDEGNHENTGRMADVEGFLFRCRQELKVTVRKKHIWLAVGHKSARQFQYWQVGSDKATGADERNFRRILAMPPQDFAAFLGHKGIT